MYQLPDATTPWKSQGEQLEAMRERDASGRKRYETDSAFRAACEAKCGLGVENSDEAPQVRISTGALSSVEGKDLGFGRIDGAEMAQLHQEVTLQSEIKTLEQRLEAHKAAAAAAATSEQAEALHTSTERGAFASQEELTRAVGSDRYRNDADYRAGVEARMALGIPGVSIKQGEGTQRHQE